MLYRRPMLSARRFLTTLLGLSMAACATEATTTEPTEATVLRSTADGIPLEMAGELAKVAPLGTRGNAELEAAMRPVMGALAAPFKLDAASLSLRKARRDERGAHHLRYAQQHEGLEVIGGDLVVHVDEAGTIYAVNGTARGDISPKLGASPIGEAAALARVAKEPENAGLALRAVRTAYLITDGGVRQVYEIEAKGTRDRAPVRDLVYVDVDTGSIATVHPQVHAALARWVKEYRANENVDFDGYVPPRKRTEGQAPVGDPDVDGSYDHLGTTYDAFKQFFGRDSFDGAGHTLQSYVDYEAACNAFYGNGVFTFGVGDNTCGYESRRLDTHAHEFTHGVTEHEANLVYGGESGGINESLSDVFGAFVKTWANSGRTGALNPTAQTWLQGADAYQPFTRNLCDPAADGVSLDVWTPDARYADVHYNSGIGNLMFCLLTKGGTHPRGATQIPVAGIGMQKAIRLAYKAQTDILTSQSNYLAYRGAMVQAATELGYDDTVREAIGCAFAAVGVGTAPPPCATDTAEPVPSLRNGVGVASIDMTAGDYRYWKIELPTGLASFTVKTSNGSGTTLYVRRGDKPTTTTYACRAATTCLLTAPAAGTYYIMAIASANVQDMHLSASYLATSGAPYLFGTTMLGLAGTAGSTRMWRIYAGGTRTPVTASLAGGTGDADLYVRVGSAPTTTDFDCRPYTTGNAETCTTSSSTPVDHYIMVKGYKAYESLSLVVSY